MVVIKGQQQPIVYYRDRKGSIIPALAGAEKLGFVGTTEDVRRCPW
jgi:hypothetical protein